MTIDDNGGFKVLSICARKHDKAKENSLEPTDAQRRANNKLVLATVPGTSIRERLGWNSVKKPALEFESDERNRIERGIAASNRSLQRLMFSNAAINGGQPEGERDERLFDSPRPGVFHSHQGETEEKNYEDQ